MAEFKLCMGFAAKLSNGRGFGVFFSLTLAERYSFKLTKDVFFPHLTMLLMKMCYLYVSILKPYFYNAHRLTVSSNKQRAATILGYDNQHIFETKMIFWGLFWVFFFAIQNSIQEVICSFVGWEKKTPYKSGLRWFEPVESLVAKPSAVTKIKTAPQRARWGMCVYVCVHACMCVCVCEARHVARETTEFFL